MSITELRAALAALITTASSFALAAPFTSGNLVVYRTGDGANALSANGNALFLDEYTTSGALVQTIALPTTGANPCIGAGNSTAEGYITRSTDGAFLVGGCFAQALPHALGLSATAPATINRVVFRVAADGTVDTTTRLTDATANPRSATTTNGTDLWLASSGNGIRYVSFGTTGTSVQLATAPTNIRNLAVFGGQLHVSSGAAGFRVASIGTGTPTTAGQAVTNLPGADILAMASPYSYLLLDRDAGVAGFDTLYVADDSAGGGIRKLSFDGTSWIARGIIAGVFRGLTGSIQAGNVTLYVTSTVAAQNVLQSYTDTAAFNANIAGGTLATIATSPAATAFRGVAFVPSGASTNPGGTGTAAPTSIVSNGVDASVLRVVVTPGTGPVSTGIGVTVDTSAIQNGAATTLTLLDSGVGCDAAAGDNSFCASTTSAFGTAANAYSLGFTITDAQARTGTGTLALTTTAPASTNPSGVGTATPGTIPADGATPSTLRVLVTPGQFPLSTALTVNANLTLIGGGAVVAMRDDGLGCDLANGAGNSDFCLLATAAVATPAIAYSLPFGITDAQARTAIGTIALTVSNSPTAPSGVGTATPNVIPADGVTSSILRVVVTPGASPVSTGLSVSLNRSAIGGGASDGMLDNGIGCDASAGDNSFCLSTTAALSTAAALYNLPFTIRDTQARTGTGSIALTVGAAPSLSVSDLSIDVGQAGQQSANVVVSIAPTASVEVSFSASTGGGTATPGPGAPADYQAISAQSFTIPANAASVNVPATIFANLRQGANRNFNLTITSSAPGIVIGDNAGVVTLNNIAPAPTTIAQIQGTGDITPLAGQTVTSLDNVVTAVTSNTFIMQMRAPGDSNPGSSDAIQIFTGGAPTVAVGDVVDLRGRVAEFVSSGGGRTLNVTQFFNTSPTIVISKVGVAGVAMVTNSVLLDGAIPSPSSNTPACPVLGSSFPSGTEVRVQNFECLEGMRINTTTGVITSPNQRFGSDLFAEMGFATGGVRSYREPGVAFPAANENPVLANLVPGAPPLPSAFVWDSNPEVFEFDADRLGQPNSVIVPGSRVTASGVLGTDFADYEFWPTSFSVTAPAPALPVAVPTPAPDQFRIGSLNLLNLFDLCDDPARPNSNEIFNVADTNRKLEKHSLYIRNVLRAPEILGVQEAEQPSPVATVCNNAGGVTTSALALLAARIAADGGPTYIVAYGPVTNDPRFISVGFLYRADLLTNISITQLAATEQWTFRYLDGSTPTPILQNATSVLHDRPPLRLEATINLVDGGTRRIAVVSNHFRSLSGIDDLRDTRATGDPVTAPTFRQDAHRVRQKRFRQGISMACQVQAYQSSVANAGVPLVLIGDHNAFEFSDGYADINDVIRGTLNPAEVQYGLNYFPPDELPCAVGMGGQITTPALEDGLFGLPANQRYSFNFQFNAQALDHALMNPAAVARFERIAFGRGNSDAPGDAEFNASSPLRASDHDGFVLYFNASATRATVSGFQLFRNSFEAP